ncbi:MAG: nucleotidyltransferase domain-containing protein [Caldilineaceae bacterium]
MQTKSMKVSAEVQARYRTALDSLTAKLEQDPYILAAIVYGSVARGEAWEKSDIDMDIIQQDGLGRDGRHVYLVEEGINISATVVSRGKFKHDLDAALQGSFSHAIRAHAKLLLCKDESIATWFAESNRIGDRDREYQLLAAVSAVPALLDKVEKWLYVKQDPQYSVVWLLNVANSLARVETIWQGEAPGREVLDQALRYNPTLFRAIYTDLLHGHQQPADIERALCLIDEYLSERAEVIFKPLLDYLDEADSPRTLSELAQHFAKKIRPDGFMWVDLFWPIEWLSRKGIITKVASPLRLTKKSPVTVEEPAFYYERDEFDWA